MDYIDLRSDTVTLPSKSMREAMYRAELGDDVYGEDPTVNRLEEMVAERLGKEAALLVVSGTMGNIVSLLTHCQRGDEVIMGHLGHTLLYEGGGISVLGGVQVRTVANLRNGLMDPAEVEDAIRDPSNAHFPRSRALVIENTHNRCGGAVIPPEEMRKLTEIVHAHGMSVHMDGARVFNAAVALGIDVSQVVADVDSVQLCFSKGLACPVGSAICASADFIAAARRNRKVVGGAMRQAGIIAAAAIVALEEMVDRLAEDHANARTLAEGISGIPGMSVELDRVQSNMVMIEITAPVDDIRQVVDGLLAEGVRINNIDKTHLRAVTHYGIDAEDIARVLPIMNGVMKELA